MSDETAPSPLERFRASMTMDYEKWRDGVGYDLGAIDDADAKERKAILAAILAHHPRDWRDVEALSQFDTAEARAALKDAARNGDTQTRMAVARHAPSLLADPFLRLWPNPATDRLWIAVADAPLEEVRLIDLTGKLRLTQQLNGSTEGTLEVGQLPAGMYLVEVRTGNGILLQKIVLQD